MIQENTATAGRSKVHRPAKRGGAGARRRAANYPGVCARPHSAILIALVPSRAGNRLQLPCEQLCEPLGEQFLCAVLYEPLCGLFYELFYSAL